MKKLMETLEYMCELYDKKMTKRALQGLISDISIYDEENLLESLRKCRSTLNHFPTISEIKDRIPGQHPGPNEAWAKMPIHEDDSVVWTKQMKEAFFIALPLIENRDLVAARVTFLEKYKKLLSEAMDKNELPEWELSLGFDKSKRAPAVKEALKLKLIDESKASELLPYEQHDEINNILPFIGNDIVKRIEK